MFTYNINQEDRDSLLHVENYNNILHTEPTKDYFRFKNADVDTVKELLDKRYLDPEDNQNESPKNIEFYNFMVDYPEYEAHGYACGGGREFRIAIEGLKGKPSDAQSRSDFLRRFRKADELDEYPDGTLRCWYD
jgi:hypothetical protein